MEKELILIPVYNEKETLYDVMKAIRELYSGCVLLVDDGSTDGSLETLNELCCENVHLISHKTNMGYGQALISGFNFSINNGYDYVLTMDCDWQHEPSYIPEFFKCIRDYDVVSGTRYQKEFNEDTDAPDDRRKINQLISKLVTKETTIEITDAFCGFKAHRVSVLNKMDLTETGYAFPLEFWVEVCMNKLSFKELPVPRIYTGAKRTFGAKLDDSEVRLAHYLEVFERAKSKYKGKKCQSISSY